MVPSQCTVSSRVRGARGSCVGLCFGHVMVFLVKARPNLILLDSISHGFGLSADPSQSYLWVFKIIEKESPSEP